MTTTARLITDYYLSRGLAVDGFDTDSREPAYALRYPDFSSVVDIFNIQGQIALFDRLVVPDGRPKIIDVWSRSYEQLFGAIAEIGFLEEAARAGVEPIVLHQSDPSPMAARNARLLTTIWPRLRVTVVHNEGAAPLGRQRAGCSRPIRRVASSSFPVSTGRSRSSWTHSTDPSCISSTIKPR